MFKIKWKDRIKMKRLNQALGRRLKKIRSKMIGNELTEAFWRVK